MVLVGPDAALNAARLVKLVTVALASRVNVRRARRVAAIGKIALVFMELLDAGRHRETAVVASGVGCSGCSS
jgi:hypothetical protein